MIVDDDVERYALAHTTGAGAALDALEREVRATLPDPEMLSGPVVGRLLQTLVFALRAQRVLEIGTYAGYSALMMAAALPPDGRLITCEADPVHAEFARRHIAQSAFADRIEVREGPALQTIATLDGPLDLVFIDADKTEYADYLRAVVDKLSPHGLIAVDNTLRSGRVLATDGTDPRTRAMQAFNDAVLADERLAVVMLTVRDGLTIIRRRA